MDFADALEQALKERGFEPLSGYAVVGRVSRVSPVHTAVRNCTRDEGGPFEVGNQVLISSHRKLLLSKAMGPSGIRHGGGAKLNQAFVRNVRTCAPMQGRSHKRLKPRGSEYRCGRTGTEQLVLGMKAL